MNIIVTGGLGFIGSAVVRNILRKTSHKIVNIDKLTYAANLDSLEGLENDNRYKLVKCDICNYDSINKIFESFLPDIIIHLAAETHVDRSIADPLTFINNNILGTFNLLEVARKYWQNLDVDKKKNFRFHHVSTDEVFGELNSSEDPFLETSPYSPNSPYSATKASADHLVRAWGRTYNLPVIISNTSNNYGPYQYPEKLIPLSIKNIIQGKNINIYGQGKQIRDWLYVDDHAEALVLLVLNAKPFSSYNIGGDNEVENIAVVHLLCTILEEQIKKNNLVEINIPPLGFKSLIKFVKDRPGHDFRYSINCKKIKTDFNWRPKHNFKEGIKKTIKSFLTTYKNF